MTEGPKKMGRPARAGAPAVRRSFRATDEEWAAWEDKAAAAGVTMNDLIRAALDAYQPKR